MKVKICGLTRLEDIQISNELKPDYVGFVFAESKRRVTPEHAFQLRKSLNTDITAVGVFVNEAIENIISLGDVIDVIQLHGSENEEYIKKLKSLTDKPIIKALSVEKTFISPDVDYLLFDGITPGSGETFDWDSIPQTNKPFFLAGGLNTNNVTKAIEKVKNLGVALFAVDVSSGVETDGVKDPIKIKKFISACNL